jgi:hypothetical protein
VVTVGQVQIGVDPQLLLPSRTDLILLRLEAQRHLLQAGQRRYTMIQVTTEGVIWDGHHGVRAAAEESVFVDVRVVDPHVTASGLLIMQLPVR